MLSHFCCQLALFPRKYWLSIQLNWASTHWAIRFICNRMGTFLVAWELGSRLRSSHRTGSEITDAWHPFSVYIISLRVKIMKGSWELSAWWKWWGGQGPRETLLKMGNNWLEEETAISFLVDICLCWKKFFPFFMSLSHICLSHKWSMDYTLFCPIFSRMFI